jgi:hypothetical protein
VRVLMGQGQRHVMIWIVVLGNTARVEQETLVC